MAEKSAKAKEALRLVDNDITGLINELGSGGLMIYATTIVGILISSSEDPTLDRQVAIDMIDVVIQELELREETSDGGS